MKQSVKLPESAVPEGFASRLSIGLQTIALAMTAVVFAFLAILALLRTSNLGMANEVLESLNIRADSWVLNFLGLALAFLFVWLLWDWLDRPESGYMRRAALSLVLGMTWLWIAMVSSIPMADSASLLDLGRRAGQGDVRSFGTHPYIHDWSYEQLYPFQLGYVQVLEILYRIGRQADGALAQMINGIALVSGYLALYRITKLIFADQRITRLLLIFLVLLPQPMLYGTFIYGNLLSFCLATWAIYGYLQLRRRFSWKIAVGIVMASVLSVAIKTNQTIVLLAIIVVLVLDLLRQGKTHRRQVLAKSLVLLVGLTVGLICASRIFITLYEWRSGNRLGPGLPMSAWLVEGLTESERAPGWSSGYLQYLPARAHEQGIPVEETVAHDLSKRLSEMAGDLPGTARFFLAKIESQWNEPTFGSIWISQVKKHLWQIGPLAQSVYDGVLGRLLRGYMDRLLFVLYLAFAGSLGFLLRTRRTEPDKLLLPLILLGAFVYHLFFEAKSQYVFMYIPYLLPFACHGLISAAASIRRISAFVLYHDGGSRASDGQGRGSRGVIRTRIRSRASGTGRTASAR